MLLSVLISLALLHFVAASHLPGQAPPPIEPGFEVVTCGSTVKLENPKSGYRLTSQSVNYGTGSGQQSVTAYGPSVEVRVDELFILKGDFGMKERCGLGQVIRCGQIIRLEHAQTGRHLHSHEFRSPVSGQQEVSGFDGSDPLDDWLVICPDAKSSSSSSSLWQRKQPIQLKHVATSAYLSVGTGHRYPHPLASHVEVRGTKSPGKEDALWQPVEGLFIAPKRGE